MQQRLQGWWQAMEVYRDRRVLAMLFLGFSSGLPFGVLAEPLSAWLSESGVTKTTIGLFALVSLPYSMKFLWAPLIDRLPLPILSALFGRRRGWTLLTQALLLLAILAMGQTQPQIDPWVTAGFALAVAFASASQDIVIDAYRVEILQERQLAAGAAMATFGWRLGQVGGGAAGLIAADFLPWDWVFQAMALMVVVGMVAILVNPEPANDSERQAVEQAEEAERFLERYPRISHQLAHSLAWFYSAVIGPLADFIRRPHWLAILAFIALYKFGDAILAIMKVPFFLEMGFSKTEIAEVVKLFGFNAIILGGFLGGWLLARIGILKGLLICGLLMALSNLIFVAQALAGHHLGMLALTIAVENITTGMGTTAFVAYLSSLCHISYTATQYALLTSLMAFSRTLMSAGAGWLADQTDWISFFLITTVAAIPGLLLLVWLMRVLPQPAKHTAAWASETK